MGSLFVAKGNAPIQVKSSGHCAEDDWLREQRDDLQALAEKWFTHMHKCGRDVRELMNDGFLHRLVGDTVWLRRRIQGTRQYRLLPRASREDPACLLKGTGKRMVPCETLALP